MTTRPPIVERLRQRSANTWCWLAALSIGLFTLVALVGNALAPADRALGRADLGHDFLAFYAAGRIAGDAAGDPTRLYDLHAVEAIQRDVAGQVGLTHVAPPVAPWWNPPHVALLFAPLSWLPFEAALATWTLVGLACLATSAWLLASMIRDVPAAARRHWRLVGVALLLAPPTLQAFGHGQNTPLSLLLLTLTVVAWRGREPLLAGLACALLCYKPQLAAIVAAALLLTLGWRVAIGLMVGLVPQGLAALTLLPGTLATFLARVPENLRHIQFEEPYLWHRHATFAGFWRMLLQGNAIGPTHLWITLLAGACLLAVAATLLVCYWRQRAMIERDDDALDRFIALAISATPLLMPFFFDYDLLLLMVAATLVGRDCLARGTAGGWLTGVGLALFAWTLVNPPLAELSAGLNLTVPLLVAAFALQAARCLRAEAAAVAEVPSEPSITSEPIAEPLSARRAA